MELLRRAPNGPELAASSCTSMESESAADDSSAPAPRFFRTSSVSRPSVQLSEAVRTQILMARKRNRRKTDWSALFRRLRPSQQQSIVRSFQKRLVLNTDTVVAGLELLIIVASLLQFSLVYRKPFWRHNRACDSLEHCVIDLPDGPFSVVNGIRFAILIMGVVRAWLRIRFIITALQRVRCRDPTTCRQKVKAAIFPIALQFIFTAVFPYPGLESIVSRHRSGILTLLTISVGVRPIFWRQILYFPYPIRQQEKVASFSGKMEFSYGTFVLKKVMDDIPLMKIKMVLVILIIVAPFLVHVVETMDGQCVWPGTSSAIVLKSSEAVCTELSEMDAFWLLTTTLVPIGYGDIAPATTAGRLLIVFSAIIAVCINAIFFSSVIRKFHFSTMESRVHAFLYRMTLYGKKDLSAVLAVQATFRYHKSYVRSLIWHQQLTSRVLYRPLSARLPNEVKKKLNISRFQASLKDIMKYDTDGDPLNAFVKHIEVITAALGTTFSDVTRLKKVFARRELRVPDKRLKLPPRITSATPSGLSLSHETTRTQMKDSASSPRATLAVVNGGHPASDVLLPSRVEEHPHPESICEPPSPGSSRNLLQPSVVLNVSNVYSTQNVTATWGEEMLRKCEETMFLLRRIEHDAKQIL